MSELPPQELNRLESAYPDDQQIMARVRTAQEMAGCILRKEMPGLFAVVGPCAMTEEEGIIDREGYELYDLQETVGEGLITAHRIPPLKDRSPKKRDTDPDPWKGLGSEPGTSEFAYRMIKKRAAATANVAIEVMDSNSLRLYGGSITFGWTGARRVNNRAELISPIAVRWGLPTGVKHGEDGNLESAMENISIINGARERSRSPAPAILIYRGGENAKTPEEWERHYREALKLTGGNMIVDSAHGGERAFHPDYKKSVQGQIKCMERIIELAQYDDELPVPSGIMMEASDASSPVDPVMPFQVAIDGVRMLHEIKMSRLRVAA